MREPRAGIPKRRLTSSRSSMHTDTAHWTRSEHLCKLCLRNPRNTIIVRGANRARRFSDGKHRFLDKYRTWYRQTFIHPLFRVSYSPIIERSRFSSFSFSWNNRVDKSNFDQVRQEVLAEQSLESDGVSHRILYLSKDQKIRLINFDISIKNRLKISIFCYWHIFNNGIFVKRIHVCENGKVVGKCKSITRKKLWCKEIYFSHLEAFEVE